MFHIAISNLVISFSGASLEKMLGTNIHRNIFQVVGQAVSSYLKESGGRLKLGVKR